MNFTEKEEMQSAKCKMQNLETGFFIFRFPFFVFRFAALLCFCGLIFVSAAAAQNKYEDRQISSIDIVFDGAEKDPSTTEQFRSIVRGALGDRYSTVKIRESLQALYDSDKIVSAQVERTEIAPNSVNLRYVIKRKTQAEKVSVNVAEAVGDGVTEQELLLKLNLLNPGTAVTEAALRSNADAIQGYLRERGFYNATVTYKQTPLESPTRVAVTFQVNPNTQAHVENFAINVKGFDASKVRGDLKLQPGALYSAKALEDDVAKIRSAILKENFLAPNLSDAKPVFDADKNLIAINLTGDVGPKVEVKVNADGAKVGEGTLQKILPVKREGTLEQSAIIEGERRLRNYFQERGYFFATVQASCSVKPAFAVDETNALENETRDLCAALTGADLSGKAVTLNYNVDLSRRLKLVDIRIEGTDKITYEDISSVLATQKASIIGVIPKLGYGRGYTSGEILAADSDRVKSIMSELGYRHADVTVRQGVSPTGDNLIITFIVNEGIPTRIDDVAIVGNKEIPTATLEAELPSVTGKNYSRARARNGVQKLSELYSREGYYDAKVNFSIVDLPKAADASEEKVKIVYNVENEGKKVFINRVLVNGNERTKEGAIRRAINLEPNDVLRSNDIFTSEQNLYGTDAFTRVEIKPEPAGQKPDGSGRLTDVIVNVEESKPRLITYGGGYSTDEGALGTFDFRHLNLFGRLQQGGARVRASRRQQLVQLDYVNPRFIREAKNRFAPLTLTAAYQRDSTVTRFFRSTFDKGTFGIVQRIDEKGKPIDTFGQKTASPTLNRLTLTAETSRTINQKTRSIVFLRYRYEDVRLYNIESLLIADLLRPDNKVRVSGLVASFVRDTRQNCNRKQTLLELIQKGDLGDPCRYNTTDPTRGSFMTADLNISSPVLGANIGFNKFQANYQTYYTFGRLKKTTLAGRAIVGLANVYSKANRFTDPQFQELNGTLPISERFFAGGSTTLRGFEFDGAGPRVVVVPQGIFRNSNREIVTLNPFTIPFGGNALVITNLEARVPLTSAVQVVPFYDGGNVFRRVGDIFRKPAPQTDSVFLTNLQSRWSNTFGLGLRIKTPFGGAAAVDYGYLLNPPQFLIPQIDGSNAIYRLRQGQLHFRFSQSF